MPACHVHDTCNYEVMYATLYVLYLCIQCILKKHVTVYVIVTMCIMKLSM